MANGATPTVFVVSGPPSVGVSPVAPTLADAITAAQSSASSATASAASASSSASAASTSAAQAAAAQVAVEALKSTVVADLNIAQADIAQITNQIALINQTAQTLIGDIGQAESAASAAQTAQGAAATSALSAANSAASIVTSVTAAAASATAAASSATGASGSATAAAASALAASAFSGNVTPLHGVVLAEGGSGLLSLTGAAGGLLQFNGTGVDPTATPTPVLGINGTTSGTLGFANAAGGGATVTLKSTQTTTAWTFNFPSGHGASNQVLQTDGAGNMQWLSLAPSATTDTTSASNISTGNLGASVGGTGRATLTAHGVLIGEGTSAVNQVAAAASGTVLVGAAAADPSFSATPVLGVNATASGSLGLANGGTSGVTTTIQATQTTTTPWTFTFPSNAGSNGQILQTDGTGNTSWVASSAVIPGYIYGLTLSNDVGTPNTKVDVAAGTATDSTNAFSMTLAAAAVINFATTGALGLDTGAQAASTWYAILLIQGTSGVSVMATKETAGSVISPSMPVGYAHYRYIGSVFSNASTHISPFVQQGQYFYWQVQTHDLVTGSATTATLFTLTVPLGVNVLPIITAFANTGGTATQGYIWSPSASSAIPQTNNVGPGTGVPSNINSMMTNLSGQLYNAMLSGGSSISAWTFGWIDPHVAPVF